MFAGINIARAKMSAESGQKHIYTQNNNCITIL